MSRFETFALEWVEAWNAHDLDRIIEHYSENIHFSSPFIRRMGISESGVITNRADLKSYFQVALQKYTDLRFELYHILEGADSVVLFYKSVNNLLSAEYMELDQQGKVSVVRAHYAG